MSGPEPEAADRHVPEAPERRADGPVAPTPLGVQRMRPATPASTPSWSGWPTPTTSRRTVTSRCTRMDTGGCEKH
jgi:hypothetical protein